MTFKSVDFWCFLTAIKRLVQYYMMAKCIWEWVPNNFSLVLCESHRSWRQVGGGFKPPSLPRALPLSAYYVKFCLEKIFSMCTGLLG